MREQISKETIEKVKAYKNDELYSRLTNSEIGLLSGVPAYTVTKILDGYYDDKKEDISGDCSTIIPLADLKHLIACEYVVSTMLKVSKLSTSVYGGLFIDFKHLYGILRAYVPDDVEQRIKDLKQKEVENE